MQHGFIQQPADEAKHEDFCLEALRTGGKMLVKKK